MEPPSPDVRAELAKLIDADRSRLGEVYRLTERGLTPPQIAQELGVGSSGFVSNNRSVARALLHGRMPSGPSIAKQIASGVRGLTRSADISNDARAYLDQLLDELEMAAGGKPRWTNRGAISSPASAPPETRTAYSLREQMDAELRTRATELVEMIGDALQLEADDYHRIVAAKSALDALARLVQVQATSRTTKALHQAGRLELSLEAAVLEWAQDLPLTTDLVESARGRLDYWRSE
jgi:hypothetical protein